LSEFTWSELCADLLWRRGRDFITILIVVHGIVLLLQARVDVEKLKVLLE
jgi:threonine/homoserine efflux transporter RhtA